MRDDEAISSFRIASLPLVARNDRILLPVLFIRNERTKGKKQTMIHHFGEFFSREKFARVPKERAAPRRVERLLILPCLYFLK